VCSRRGEEEDTCMSYEEEDTCVVSLSVFLRVECQSACSFV
jgi:hypothetical protein